MSEVVVCELEVNEFKIQSRNYVHLHEMYKSLYNQAIE